MTNEIYKREELNEDVTSNAAGNLEEEMVKAENSETGTVKTGTKKRKDLKDQFVQIRKSTGMNRREFAEYFGIPYRTMQDWELGNRQMPEYLFHLIAYKVEMEKPHK